MQLQERNYWLTTVPELVKSGDAELPESVDVAVVGAGFTGLAAALALAKAGASVVVLEAHNIGWGASSRNAGMALTGLKMPVTKMLALLDREQVKRMYTGSLHSVDHLERVIQDEQIDCNYSRSGHLYVACKQAHFDSFADLATVLKQEFNHTVRLVPKGELQEEIGSSIYFGGIVDDLSAGVNPARYIAGLAGAAVRAGAIICHQTAVAEIKKDGTVASKRFCLRTARGSLKARDVVLATGAYTSDVFPALRKKVIPIGSYIIATEVLPSELVDQLSPRGRMIFDSKNFLYYYRVTPDNRMLFGGRAAFSPESEDTVRQSAEILRRGMVNVYPQLAKYSVEYAWGGTIDPCFDLLPHAGLINDMYYGVGYAGHGLAMATYFGSAIAEAISGKASALPFYNIPFPDAPIGLRSGCSWALPLAEAYFKVIDWTS